MPVPGEPSPPMAIANKKESGFLREIYSNDFNLFVLFSFTCK